MMKKITFFLFFSSGYLLAQQSINTLGGNGSGIGGNFSFTIGQLDYVSANGIGGFVSQGIQQSFEIYTLANDEIPSISLELNIYPNPTTDVLFIKNENSFLTFQHQLIDNTGKPVGSISKMVQTDHIDMSTLSSGIYILQIKTINNLSKSFKIIKK